MIMRRIILIIFTFYILSGELLGQEPPFNYSRGKEQVDFIKKDTLPVKVSPLSKTVNTNYSEYNGILFSDSTFYFSSMRNESEEDFGNLFEAYWSTYIYSSKLTIGGYSKPVSLPVTINSPKYFNCNFTFNKDRTLIIFARSPLINSTDLRCELWMSEKIHGKWQKSSVLNHRINLPGCNTTQPYYVEYDDYAILYFSTDRPKGFGGMDIWYSVYKEGRFGDPINLGSIINTSGDEVTPFYDTIENILYFSSNRHVGIGGYDIFYSRGSMSDWTQPSNMGVPFNSEKHDIYFTRNSFNRNGYFSSNRPTSKSLPEDTCCYDIYNYAWIGKMKEPSLDTTVADTVTIVEKIKMILPLTLYFQNDEPDPRSWNYDTKQNYQNTLSDYLSVKELYKDEYSKGLKDNEKAAAEESIERFFKDSVEQGFVKLEMLSEYLLQELNSGRSVTLVVSGYASSLHDADYNLRLSARRIASLSNYLREYENSILKPFMEGNAGNKLIIKSKPYGSDEAISKHVSGNINDKRNSVYSIAASLERRIQIVEVE